MTPPRARGVRPSVRRLLLLVACCSLACEDPSGPEADLEWSSLVRAEDWTDLAAEDDPLAHHRPSPVLCEVIPWHPEGGGIEVETEGCNYVALTQPLTRDLAEGDLVRITAWWERLAADPPATGHLAVLIGGEVLWEASVAIPGDAELRELEFESPIDADAGTPVVFHLHNHGYNTWRLQTLQVAHEDE